MSKSITKSIFIVLSITLCLAACEKLEIPTSAQNGEITVNSDSTIVPDIDKMYSVSDVLKGDFDSVNDVYVVGYIVGYINGTSIKSAEFNAGNSATNILLADTPIEDDYSNCIPVQLSLSTLACKKVRDEINLLVNPNMLHKKIYIQGNIDSYMRVIGLKETKNYKILKDDFNYNSTDNDSTEINNDSLLINNNDNINDSLLQNDDSLKILYKYIETNGVDERTAFSVNDALTIIPTFLKIEHAIGLGDGYIKGFIVGYINGGSTMNTAVFNAGKVSNNIIIADNREEKNTEKCIAIQLTEKSTNNKNAKEALNLSDNPQNLGREIIVLGSIEKYMGKIGVKNTKGYMFIE